MQELLNLEQVFHWKLNENSIFYFEWKLDFRLRLKKVYHFPFLTLFNWANNTCHISHFLEPSVTKKRGCKIKQHPDLLYGYKQLCNVWASGTKHNHWSFPSYFVSKYSCMHSLINSQTQFLRIQIGRIELQKPTLTSRIQKLPESTSFLTPEYSSKFRILLRSNPSYVHHHLLGQVAGVAENSNNQPSPLKTELYTLHSQR